MIRLAVATDPTSLVLLLAPVACSYVYQMTGGQKYFVKLAMGRDEKMFKGEALGLQAMYGELRMSRV